ncbi:MAG: hypothetical protein GXO77_08760 [Calditrichaeota bacterium]|nr:hypothetical protein [Calditrichota bacterium]
MNLNKIIFGIKYKYSLEIYFDEAVYFDIYSKHLQTNSISVITNLNFIISEFSGLLSENDEYEESTWTINDKKTAMVLWEDCLQSFNDKDFLKYLEKYLDEDRTLGGWNATNDNL